MLKIALVDANVRANEKYAGMAVSIVAGWLSFEAKNFGVVLCEPKEADIILLSFAGAMDYISSCKKYLKKYNIEPMRVKRKKTPYIIAGGAVDASPFEAIEIADCVAIGEAYNFIRVIFNKISNKDSLESIIKWIIEYPHAIEASQIEHLERDTKKPWLLKCAGKWQKHTSGV